MQKFTTLLLVGIFLAIQGCSTTKLTPKQEEALAISTLNVYSDNRVLFKTSQQDRYKSSQWVWSRDKDTVIAVAVHGRFYNAKDIARIVEEQTSTRSAILAIYLKSGKKLTASAAPPQGNGYSAHTPAWITCSATKQCGNYRKYFFDYGYYNDFGGNFYSIYDEYLNNSDSPRKIGSRVSFMTAEMVIMKDYRATPNHGLIESVEDITLDNFEKKVAESLVARKLRDSALLQK